MAHPALAEGPGNGDRPWRRDVPEIRTYMCGIVGAFVYKSGNFTVTEPYLVRMRDTMVHRGPDGAGVWISPDREIGLGHRRLSIIDLSTAANQPMAQRGRQPPDRLQRRDLQPRRDPRRSWTSIGRHRWKTDHSDTEVILHAFEEWGIDCLHRFRGMFAIALWDGGNASSGWSATASASSRSTTAIHHGRLAFASEIKALLADPDQSARSTRRRSSTTCRSSPRRPRRRCSRASASCPAAPGSGSARTAQIAGAPLLGRAGTTRPRSSASPRKRSPSAPRRAADGRAAAQGERRARRRLPLRRHRLEHERGALLRGRRRAGQDLLHRLRRRVPSYQNELHYARRMAERGRRRAPRAAAHHRRPDRLPAPDGPAPGRADRRPGLRAGLLRLEARARQRRDRLPGRRGRRRALLGLPLVEDMPSTCSATTTCRCRGSSRRWACWPAGSLGRDQTPAVRMAAPRSAGQPVFWGGAEAFTEAQKQTPALAAAPAAVRRTSRPGRRSGRSGSVSRRRPGSRPISTG